MKLEDLFENDEWDEVTHMCFAFYNCKLKQTIGKFKAGTRVSNIIINFETGILQIIPLDASQDEYTEYHLGYTFKEVT